MTMCRRAARVMLVLSAFSATGGTRDGSNIAGDTSNGTGNGGFGGSFVMNANQIVGCRWGYYEPDQYACSRSHGIRGRRISVPGQVI